MVCLVTTNNILSDQKSYKCFNTLVMILVKVYKSIEVFLWQKSNHRCTGGFKGSGSRDSLVLRWETKIPKQIGPVYVYLNMLYTGRDWPKKVNVNTKVPSPYTMERLFGLLGFKVTRPRMSIQTHRLKSTRRETWEERGNFRRSPTFQREQKYSNNFDLRQEAEGLSSRSTEKELLTVAHYWAVGEWKPFTVLGRSGSFQKEKREGEGLYWNWKK